MDFSSFNIQGCVDVGDVTIEILPEIDGFDGEYVDSSRQYAMCSGCSRGRGCVYDGACLEAFSEMPIPRGSSKIYYSFDRENLILTVGSGDSFVSIFRDGDHIGVQTDFSIGSTYICFEDGRIMVNGSIVEGSFIKGWYYYYDHGGEISACYSPKYGLVPSMVLRALFDEGFCGRELQTFVYFFEGKFVFSPQGFPKLENDLSLGHDYLQGQESLGVSREDYKLMKKEKRQFEPLSTLTSITREVKKKLYRKNSSSGDVIANFASGRHDVSDIGSVYPSVVYVLDNDAKQVEHFIENFNKYFKNQQKLFLPVPIVADITKPLVDSTLKQSFVRYAYCDTLYCFYAFQHFCSSQVSAVTAVINMVRSVRQGGKIVLTVPDEQKLLSLKNNSQLEIKCNNRLVPGASFGFGRSYSVTIKPNYIDLKEYFVPISLVCELFQHYGCKNVLNMSVKDYYLRDRVPGISSSQQRDSLDASDCFKILIFVKNGTSDKNKPRVKVSKFDRDKIVRAVQRLSSQVFVSHQRDSVLDDDTLFGCIDRVFKVQPM